MFLNKVVCFGKFELSKLGWLLIGSKVVCEIKIVNGILVFFVGGSDVGKVDEVICKVIV